MAKFTLDKRFKKTVVGKFERFQFQMGILKDAPHREPRPPSQVLKERGSAKAKAKTPMSGPVIKKKGKAKKNQSLIKTKIDNSRKGLKKRLTSKKTKAALKHKALVKSHTARGLGTMEGGPVRLMKKTTKGTVAKVGEYVRRVHKIPYLTAPFTRPKSKEMKEFVKRMGQLITGENKNYSNVETALRAVIRVPILKKKYGANSQSAAKRKTFNRLAIDTGQFYRAIDAKVKVNPNVQK